MKQKFDIAYFSAEIGISSSLPTYSGGLGVLAGDHIKAAGDIGLNMCAITLLYREGYFKQRIDEEGIQTETYPRFDPYPLLKKLDVKFTLRLRARDVWIQVYRFDYVGMAVIQYPSIFLTQMWKKISKMIGSFLNAFIPGTRIIVFSRKPS